MNLPNEARDWRALNLADGGRSLIEASAGAGKTWTIAVLYLRLLLERELSPRQIVVATFTNAAAQELRERLRGRLLWALRQIDSPAAATADGGEIWLHERWRDEAARREQDRLRLQLALAEMDLAPVGTLHGLCGRILADHPFACGAPFAAGELIDGAALLEEVADDLWRRLQQADDDDALAQRQRAALPKLTRRRLGHGLRLCLRPDVTIPANAGDARIDDGMRTWTPRLRDLLSPYNDGYFRARCALRDAWAELADCLEGHLADLADETLEKLADAAQLTAITKAGKADAEVRAVAAFSAHAAARIRAAREQAELRLWADFADFAGTQIAARLRARHQSSFDELLGTVGRALRREMEGGGARPLADALYAAWPVALVDEFQDTDAAQYGILDAIYRDADRGARGRLVMIGDPKQAIYRFRGGDIHAYRRAAAQAGERLTLRVNHRSARAYVAACNEFYACGGAQLGAGESEASAIGYETVASSARRDREPYTIDGAPCTQPLRIHYWRDPPASAPHRRALALRVCADRIATLLQSRAHRIGGEPVRPEQIAVLLPRNGDVETLRGLLGARGVPCAASTRRSVFDSDLARELQMVLFAVAHPDDPGALRAAAATRLWGENYAQLRARGDAAADWEPLAQRFRDWRAIWRARGVQRVVEELLERRAGAYLETPGGERALTDLRHLGELLQQRSTSLGGVEELLAWLRDCRERGFDGDEEASDAAQLRIESDRACVQLMTLHASKGLEFPLVFLPLMWDQGERAGEPPFLVEDAAGGGRHLAVSAQAQREEKRDLQDERFRMLYVALTRAIHACHVDALPPDRPASARTNAPPAQGTARSALDATLARLQPPLDSPELARAAPSIAWLDAQVGDIADTPAHYLPDAPPPRPRAARAMPPRSPGPLAARHSFTTLTREAQAEASMLADAAGDEAGADAHLQWRAPARAGDPAHAELLALDAARGVEFGNALHAIFERRRIGVPIAAQRELVERALEETGTRIAPAGREAFVGALMRRVQAVLDAPLGETDLRLGKLRAADLRAEMEFHFALDRVSMSALRDACAAHGEPALVPRSARVLSGLMTGKIDLVFHHAGRCHVLDYKSNRLGDALADYRGAPLFAAMDAHHYRFQALLYTVALDRYLRQRLGSAYRRDAHLGECFYLFVRAFGIAPDAGVWRHRFAATLLDAVGAALHGATREAGR